jgi:hypothetical protein
MKAICLRVGKLLEYQENLLLEDFYPGGTAAVNTLLTNWPRDDETIHDSAFFPWRICPGAPSSTFPVNRWKRANPMLTALQKGPILLKTGGRINDAATAFS